MVFGPVREALVRNHLLSQTTDKSRFLSDYFQVLVLQATSKLSDQVHFVWRDGRSVIQKILSIKNPARLICHTMLPYGTSLDCGEWLSPAFSGTQFLKARVFLCLRV